MKGWLLLTLLAGPLGAQDLLLHPQSFLVSPGERVTVVVAGAPPARLKDASMYTAVGAYNMLNLRVDAEGAAVDVSIKGPGTPLLAIRTAPAPATVDAAVFRAWLQKAGLEEMIEWREKNNEAAKPARALAMSFAKSILLAADKTDEAYHRRAGHTLEIIPERNPYGLHPGDELPVRVLLHGNPAVNLLLRASAGTQQEARRTDSTGRAALPLARAGRWQLEIAAVERCPDPSAADWNTFRASLTFELK